MTIEEKLEQLKQNRIEKAKALGLHPSLLEAAKAVDVAARADRYSTLRVNLNYINREWSRDNHSEQVAVNEVPDRVEHFLLTAALDRNEENDWRLEIVPV